MVVLVLTRYTIDTSLQYHNGLVVDGQYTHNNKMYWEWLPQAVIVFSDIVFYDIGVITW